MKLSSKEAVREAALAARIRPRPYPEHPPEPPWMRYAYVGERHGFYEAYRAVEALHEKAEAALEKIPQHKKDHRCENPPFASGEARALWMVMCKIRELHEQRTLDDDPERDTAAPWKQDA